MIPGKSDDFDFPGLFGGRIVFYLLYISDDFFELILPDERIYFSGIQISDDFLAQKGPNFQLDIMISGKSDDFRFKYS